MDHFAEAERVLEEGRKAARNAHSAARSNDLQLADSYGKKAHGCWMQAQAHATLALIQHQAE